MTAHLINARDSLDYALRLVQSPNDLIEHGGDLFDHALVNLVLRIDRENFLPGRIFNHLGKGQPAQLRVFLQEPRNEGIDWRGWGKQSP